MATTIQEFLIKFGFLTDQASAKRFHDTMDHGVRQIKEFRLAVAGMALGLEEAVRRTTRNFDQLFFAARNTGVPAKMLANIQYGFKEIGMSAEAATAAISGLAVAMREPGTKGQIQAWVGPVNDAGDAFVKLARKYRQAMDQGADAEYAFRHTLEAMPGVDAEALRNAALSIDIFEQGMKTRERVAARFGLKDKEAAEAARKAQSAWNEFTLTIATGIGKLVTDNLGSITKLFETLSAWFQDPATIKAVGEIVDEITKLFSGEGNREAFNRDLGIVKGLFTDIVWIVKELIKGLEWVDKNWGPEWAAGLALAMLGLGPSIVKGLISGITRGMITIAWEALFGPAVTAAAKAGTMAGAGFATKMAMGLRAALGGGIIIELTHWALDSLKHSLDNWLAKKMGPEFVARQAAAVVAEDKRKSERGIVGKVLEAPEDALDALGLGFGPPEAAIQYLRDHPDMPGAKEYFARNPDKRGGYQHGGIVPIDAHAGEMVLPQPISQGLQQMFMKGPAYQGGGLGGGNNLYDLIDRWLVGGTAFRPFVNLADATFEKLHNLFLDFFDEKTGEGGGSKPGGGAGGGEGGGEGGGKDGGGKDGGGGDKPDTGTDKAGILSQKALEAIAKGEGTFHSGSIDYNEIYGSKHLELANMTLNQVMEYQRTNMGKHTPVGAFQITRATLSDLSKALHFDPDETKMTPEVQRALATQLYKTRGFNMTWVNKDTQAGITQKIFEQLRQSGELYTTGPAMGGGQPLGSTPAGPDSPAGTPGAVVDQMVKMSGTRGAAVKEFLRDPNGVMRRNPDLGLWCAAFTSAYLQHAGVKGPPRAVSNLARAYASWGHHVALNAVKKGDILLNLNREHVGVATGKTWLNTPGHLPGEVEEISSNTWSHGRLINLPSKRWRRDVEARRSDELEKAELAEEEAQRRQKTGADLIPTKASRDLTKAPGELVAAYAAVDKAAETVSQLAILAREATIKVSETAEAHKDQIDDANDFWKAGNKHAKNWQDTMDLPYPDKPIVANSTTHITVNGVKDGHEAARKVADAQHAASARHVRAMRPLLV